MIHTKYAGFVRVNDAWRFEGWLVDGLDFNAPDNGHPEDAEQRIAGIRKMVELENGEGSYQIFAFVDGARAGKEGGADGNNKPLDLPEPPGHPSGLTVTEVKRVDGE